MKNHAETHGERIRELLAGATEEARIIAPFIKVRTFRSLLRAVPPGVRLLCVTRWLPQDVADGISDVEVLDVLDERGDYRLTLVDTLHAKVYMAGERCLVGSANVTAAGLGDERDSGNVEVLVEKTASDPDIVALMDQIARLEHVATKGLAEAVQTLAQSLPEDRLSVNAVAPWHPRSRKPELAYRFYSTPPRGFLKAAHQSVVRDLQESSLPPGLSEEEFTWAIRKSLAEIKPATRLLRGEGDLMLTRGEAFEYFQRAAAGKTTPNDLWMAFVEWMAHFFSDTLIKQEIADVALRRAVLMQVT